MEDFQPFQAVVNGKDHAIIPSTGKRQIQHQVDQEKKETRDIEKVDCRHFLFDDLLALRKDEEKMEQKRREDEQGNFIQPVKEAVQKIQFSCRGKDVKRVKDKTKKIEIKVGHGKGSFRVEKNNNAYNQGGQPDESQVKIGQLRSPEGQKKGREKEFSLPADLIFDFLSRYCRGPVAFSNINFVGYRQVIDGIEDVFLFNPGQISRAVWFDPYGCEPAGFFSPNDPVGQLFPDNFFIDIHPSEHQDNGYENEG
jgi:hypothetical protein